MIAPRSSVVDLTGTIDVRAPVKPGDVCAAPVAAARSPFVLWLRDQRPEKSHDAVLDRNLPSAERACALLRQAIDAALYAIEPAIDIAQQDLGCIRNNGPDLARATWTFQQRGGTRQCLLAVCGHNRHFRHSA